MTRRTMITRLRLARMVETVAIAIARPGFWCHRLAVLIARPALFAVLDEMHADQEYADETDETRPSPELTEMVRRIVRFTR